MPKESFWYTRGLSMASVTHTVKLQMEWNGATVTVTIQGDDLNRVVDQASLALRKLRQRGACDG